MQSTNWAPEHSDALRVYLAKGMSYSGIFDAINANGLRPPKDLPGHWPRRPPKAKAPGLRKLRERHPPEFIRPMPVSERTEVVKLRCVEIAPRHLSLIDLEPGDCRYPYGVDEDGEAITFCGHPRRQDSSYCTPHFHLTRGPGTASERAARA